MTKWTPLSDVVLSLHRWGPSLDLPPETDLRTAAAALAIKVYSQRPVIEQPALVNTAALALSMPRLVVHRISPGAVNLVHSTDLHSLPNEPPRLLRGAWIIETKRPDGEPLFGRTVCLAGYHVEGEGIFLQGTDYPDGVFTAKWTPQWAGGDLEAGVVRDTSPLIDDVDRHHEWTRQAARFAVVLGLLLDAEGSPVVAKDETPAGRRQRGTGSGKTQTSWTVRRVFVGRDKVFRAAGASEPAGEGAERRDLSAAVVPVRGHLKRQPYGPGRSERKWIYVQGYEARRWVAPGPVRVDVDV